jgi:hypothetical protein
LQKLPHFFGAAAKDWRHIAMRHLAAVAGALKIVTKGYNGAVGNVQTIKSDL